MVTAKFIGRCAELEAADLAEYDDTSREIDNAKFVQLIGLDHYSYLEFRLGYGDWLRMRDDRCVEYTAGVWKGRPAACCFWSQMHHLYFTDVTTAEVHELHAQPHAEAIL